MNAYLKTDGAGRIYEVQIGNLKFSVINSKEVFEESIQAAMPEAIERASIEAYKNNSKEQAAISDIQDALQKHGLWPIATA